MSDMGGERLSGIATHWSVVRVASESSDRDSREARRQILHLYGGAVHRYLLGAVRNKEAADDLFQDFAARFLEGRIRGADPARGRFRDYVKGVLYHMIADHSRSRKRGQEFVSDKATELAAAEVSSSDLDDDFIESWRNEILLHCWEYLKQLESESGQPFHTVLHYRAENPRVPSQRIAEVLSGDLERPLNGPAVRQILHRAREKFADELLKTVAHSLGDPTRDAIEEELLTLGLREYCRAAFDRWADGGKGE